MPKDKRKKVRAKTKRAMKPLRSRKKGPYCDVVASPDLSKKFPNASKTFRGNFEILSQIANIKLNILLFFQSGFKTEWEVVHTLRILDKEVCSLDENVNKRRLQNAEMNLERKNLDTQIMTCTKTMEDLKQMLAALSIPDHFLSSDSTELNHPYLNILRKLSNKDGNIEDSMALLKQFIANHPEYLNHSLFEVACGEDWVGIVRHINENDKVDLNAMIKQGATPLIIASKQKALSVILYLLQQPSINPNTRGTGGVTALHWAACNGATDIVDALLTHAATDVNAMLEDGYWPVFNHSAANAFTIALQNRYFDILDLITADNRYSPNSETELVMILVTPYPNKNQQLNHCKALVEKGCDYQAKVKIQNKVEGSAIDFARWFYLDEIVNYIEKL